MTFSLVELENKLLTGNSGLAIQRPGLYPSEASVEYVLDGTKIVLGKCLRAAWYRSMEVEKEGCGSPKLAMTGQLGKGCEQQAIDRWKKLGLYVDNNIKFFNRDLAISGELDCVIKDPEDSDRWIGIEVKSIYGYYAGRVLFGAKRPPTPGVPKDGQFLQSVFYAWQYRDKLDEYRMYYVERGSGERCEFVIGTEEQADGTHTCWWEQLDEGNEHWNHFLPDRMYQPYSIEDVINRSKLLLHNLKHKILPPKDFSSKWNEEKVEFMFAHGLLGKTKYKDWQKSPTKNPVGNWNCDWCDYKAQCEQDELTAAIGDNA